MPQIYRITGRGKTSIFISDIVWARMQKRPNVFGKEWKLVLQSIGIPKPPIHKSLIVGDDLADAKSPKNKSIKYTEEKYREDLKSARLLLNAGNKEDALFMYQRAFIFRKSPYVKKQIKLLS